MALGELQMPESGYAKVWLIVFVTALSILSVVFFGIFLADHYVSTDEGEGKWDDVADELDEYGGSVSCNSSTFQVSKDDSVSAESDGLMIHKANGNYVFCPYTSISAVSLKAH